MIFRYLLFLLFLPNLAFSQENLAKNDTIKETLNYLFIEKHPQQLNISFEVSNERTNFSVPFEDEEANVKSNLNTKYAFVFSYKFISVRLGLRPSISGLEKQNKGKTKIFRLRVKLLFDRWSHYIEYVRNEGYYIANTTNFEIGNIDDNFHIQFPNLTTNIFQGSSFYNFNNNYSVRAVESQTEIQIKSAGAFMPGVDYKYYNLKEASEMKISPDEIITRNIYSDISGFNLVLNTAYHYTYVIRNYWFLNGYANAGGGIDFYKSKTYTPDNSFNNSDNDFFFLFKTGISGGYNGRHIFAGAGYDFVYSSEKFNGNDIQVQPSKDKFHVYVGYRFRAPKQLRKPVEKIEDMIPILKEEGK